MYPCNLNLNLFYVDKNTYKCVLQIYFKLIIEYLEELQIEISRRFIFRNLNEVQQY